MGLGVDISDLVHLRNVPPTPANYAQRSGRAGRQGQPGLVFTYCGALNSHDQYYFARREHMVAGSVRPPRLDMAANESLVRAPGYAVWLAQVRLPLGQSKVKRPSAQSNIEAPGTTTTRAARDLRDSGTSISRRSRSWCPIDRLRAGATSGTA